LSDQKQNVEVVIQTILTQFKSGDIQGALTAAQDALTAYPDKADLHHLTSRFLETLNAKEQALEMMESATQQPDSSPNYFLELATMYVEAERFEDAETAYKAHLKVLPNSPRGSLALAHVYQAQGNLKEAEKVLRTAVDVVAGDAETEMVRLNDLATWLRQVGKPKAAIDVMKRALKLAPQRPELHFNIANAFMDAGALDEAIEHYRQTLDFNAHHPDTHLHLGFAYLLKGNFKRGWREMEWRWKIPVFAETALNTPRWHGAKIKGTVLLLAEQGLGDSVHFIRYAKQVAERCSRVIAYVPPHLVRLISTAPGVEETYGWDHPIPQHDAYVPMMSLPAVFKTELHTIPAEVPYLSANAKDIASWQNTIKDLPGPKIGIVWQGNPQNAREATRAIPTKAVLNMVRSFNASFICLHKDRPQNITDWPDNLHHFGDRFNDVADAAALVETLDLVLSIDTLMTHLAGALNKDLWTLLAPVADWRYLLDRDDSPWYPSARLIRRTETEDWDAFMDRILNALKARF